MKYLNILLAGLMMFAIAQSTSAQPTFYLRFETVTANGTDYEVDIYMAGSSTFTLGSSNLQFTFNESDMDNPSLDLTESTSLISSSFYSTTISKPVSNKASLNIFLFIPSFGDVNIGSHPGWTKLARLHFDVLNPAGTTNLQWSYTGATTETVVFLDDESTQIFVGNPGADLVDLVGDPLPIELSSFEAFPHEEMVELKWTSALEINFEGYELQRSDDGHEFSPIAWIPGIGNEFQRAEYRHEDKNILYNQSLYYRLKQVDLDGSFTYSEIRVAKVLRDGITEMNIAPNPANDYSKLLIESTVDGLATIEIFNSAGMQISRYEERVYEALNIVDLDIHAFAPGMYHIVVTTGKEKISRKLIKL